jgi:hypothetical protein
MRAIVPWQVLIIVARSDLMNPSGVKSFWSMRALKIAALSLSLVLSAVGSVDAQAQQLPRPASREAARPGTSQGFLSWLRQLAPTPRGESCAVPFPPLPRPRPAELTSTPMEPMPEKLAPASIQSDQMQTPTEPAPARDEPNEGPLND